MSSWLRQNDGAATLGYGVSAATATITHRATSSREQRLHENRDGREFCMDASFNRRPRSSRVHPARRRQFACRRVRLPERDSFVRDT